MSFVRGELMEIEWSPVYLCDCFLLALCTLTKLTFSIAKTTFVDNVTSILVHVPVVLEYVRFISIICSMGIIEVCSCKISMFVCDLKYY